MKLSQRTAKFLFAPTVVLFMSGTSFILTVINQGINADFIGKWLTGFGISFVIALPLSILTIPRIQKFFNDITEQPVDGTAKTL